MDTGIVNSSNSQKTPPINNSKKCLLFDRRYGLVYDVWKDPSEEALSGGRGMFCIVPLSKALIKSASDTQQTPVATQFSGWRAYAPRYTDVLRLRNSLGCQMRSMNPY